VAGTVTVNEKGGCHLGQAASLESDSLASQETQEVNYVVALPDFSESGFAVPLW
jgi:hypothetical protein